MSYKPQDGTETWRFSDSWNRLSKDLGQVCDKNHIREAHDCDCFCDACVFAGNLVK